MNKLNKKGFTLIELLAVIVILALIIVIVATKGFGAFDNTKEKIASMNKDAILDVAEIIKLDIEHCDDSDEDLLNMFNITTGSCSDLLSRLGSGEINISPQEMINNNYITGKKLEEIENLKIYGVIFKIESNKVTYTVKDEIKKATLLKRDSNLSTENYYQYKDQIVEIEFVDYVDIEGKEEGINYWNVTDSALSDTDAFVYAWLEDVGGQYKLYFGSDEKIYAPEISSYFFKDFISLESISFDNFDTSQVINMYGMFWGCETITKLNLNYFDTSQVTSMGCMFYNCFLLRDLKISNFNTKNVKNLSSMFRECKSLIELDLSNFNTENVTDMSTMFYSCISLQSLNVKSFNTEQVKKMEWMFGKCTALSELDLSNFKTSVELESVKAMFQYSIQLTYLDLSGFETIDSLNVSEMFFGTSNLNKVCVDQNKSSNIYNAAISRGVSIGCN